MKKKFKKLTLTTETLRNLGDPGLKEAVGANTLLSKMSDCVTINICTLCTRRCTVCDTCPPCVP